MPHNIAQEASALGVQLQRVEARRPEDFEGAFAVMVEGGANTVMILASGLFSTNLPRLLALARTHQLPTMAGARHYAEAGSLLAYGANPFDLCQRSAVFVDKILKGAKPADLPVERAYKFALVVNLKTADALASLYRQRWQAERNRRSLKSVLQMDHLRGASGYWPWPRPAARPAATRDRGSWEPTMLTPSPAPRPNPSRLSSHSPALLFSNAEFYYTLWYDTACGHTGGQRGGGRL